MENKLNQNKLNLRNFDLAFIDTETTGRGFKNELIEIAVIRVNNYNFAILEEWETKIKPRNLELAEAESLKITGYNEKDWENALDEETALKIFLQKTEKSVLVGHNISFDLFYIYKALAAYNLMPTFWYKSLDTFSLAWQKLRNKSDIQRLSLGEIANYFGIIPERPHSALDDARTTYKIFIKLLEV